MGQGGGRWGGGHQRATPNNWSDLAGDEGGRRGGCGPGRRARGGRWGGAPESSVGATMRSLVHLLGSLKNLTIGLIWLVTRGGGVGQGGGQGGVEGGGHQRAVSQLLAPVKT